MEKGQREYFLRQQLKAIQEELGEVDEQAGRGRASCASRSRRPTCPSTRCKQAERELQRFERLPPQSAEHGVIRTLPRVDRRRCRGRSRPRTTSTSRRRARQLDRDHYDIEKVKDRILEFLAVRKLKPDARCSILCFVGPARRGQDLARQVDRRRDGPRVRAHLGRRRARRVRDPRPPPHLHRRDARHDRPRAARRRLEQPGADDRRDRQDGRRLPRRPVQRDARGARPRAELELPRPLPGPAVRPLERPVHHHGQPARPDPGAAARPHGGDRARRATPRRRSSRSPSATWCRARSSATAWRKSKIEFTDEALRADHRGLHARGRRAQPRARDRRGLPQGRARVRRGHAQVASARSRPKAGDRAARQAPLPARDVARRTGEPGVATGLAWTPVGGDVLFVEATAVPGRGQAAGHRPARRRDEGVGRRRRCPT